MFKVQADRRGGVFITTDRDAADGFAEARGSAVLAFPLGNRLYTPPLSIPC